jgi:hypothetical protein
MTTTPKHHLLAPSSMSRIVECPGSKGADSHQSNAAADLGTLIHAAGAGASVVVPEGEDREVFEKCIAVWHDFLIEVMPDDPTQLKQEEYLESKTILDFGGTADLLIVTDEFLHVADLKTGQGEVSVHDNKQIGSYLNLAREKYGPRERYYGTIIQPRLDYQETVEFTARDLSDLRERIADAANSDDLRPGSHCRYCPLLATCSKAQQAVVDILRDGTPVAEPDETISAELNHWKQFVEYADVFDSLVATAKVKLLDAISDGVNVPGYKAATHGARRGWTSQEAALIALSKMGLQHNDIFEPQKVKSPAQIEKMGVQIPMEVLYQPPGTLILAKASSRKRAAVIANGKEFS